MGKWSVGEMPTATLSQAGIGTTVPTARGGLETSSHLSSLPLTLGMYISGIFVNCLCIYVFNLVYFAI